MSPASNPPGNASPIPDLSQMFPLFGPMVEYAVDAMQRGVLFLDVMRQRGNQYHEHLAEKAPHVLEYKAELVLDGRTLGRPVNYALARIVPPPDVTTDPRRRPFVVVDPRAGHGPGIGGFKADSEIGMALRAGHPCYFIGFLPDPMPGQTIEDVARTEAVFLEKVIALHPEADGKPAVIGNCQAGWAVMILAAMRPDLLGPIIVAGSPLSYWAGVHGHNPMRYSGGLLGGSWLATLASDLGAGTFDGAWLVSNFEGLNPANTLWTKQYNLYSKVDTEAERYLGFERWWGGHVYLTAEEIQFIVDELFVGNNLAAGRIQSSDGMTVDLRNIRSPIVVFCSKGDNITPPQQALGWILDLYSDVDEIKAHGQTIVYTIHESVGHLGIFVSTGVARKEYDEFASNIDLIDLLPPGLYEATFEAKTEDTHGAELAHGRWVMRCVERTLGDIRALGGNDAADERRFAAAARISDTNLALYRTLVQPLVRALTTPATAEFLRNLHPLRTQYEVFADTNPLMAPIAQMAEWVRAHRTPVSADNPLVALQNTISNQIVTALEACGVLRDKLSEQQFLSFYGSPLLQAALGIDPKDTRPQRRAGRSVLSQHLIQAKIAELTARMGTGGLRECAIRGLIYAGLPRGGVDERGLAALRNLKPLEENAPRITLSEFKAMAREQYFMLLLDPETALAAIPSLLPPDLEVRRRAFGAIREVLAASGDIQGEVETHLRRVEALFGLGAEPLSAPRPAGRPGGRIEKAKAS